GSADKALRRYLPVANVLQPLPLRSSLDRWYDELRRMSRMLPRIEPEDDSIPFGRIGGLTSKVHALVETNGLPVRLALTAGETQRQPSRGKTPISLEVGSYAA